jgi:hypothetical protein
MNSLLEKEIKKWKRSGSRPQEGLDWSNSKANWIRDFPEYSSFIKSLPQVIDRDYLRSVCSSIEITTLHKFLVVMIWGYSNLGYGTYRVSRIMSQANFDWIIDNVTDLANSGNPKVAYDFLMRHRINGLGPSYSSKFISFNTPRDISAPILDSLIMRWIGDYALEDYDGLSIRKMNWNLKTYSHYCDWVRVYAEKFEIFPDEVELVLFRIAEQEYSSSSNWVTK